MGKKSIEGQMDLFSLIDTVDIYDDNNLPIITMSENENSSIFCIEEPGNISLDSPAETPKDLQEELDLDLEEGDVIWAIIDKKIESHIIIKARKKYCITQAPDGTTRRLTIRSKGIVWEYTRDAAQRLFNQK